ncbi:hypothetical protein B484DRAFT_441603, partial [Ochromonadaceae sp. CCMP2298]
ETHLETQARVRVLESQLSALLGEERVAKERATTLQSQEDLRATQLQSQETVAFIKGLSAEGDRLRVQVKGLQAQLHAVKVANRALNRQGGYVSGESEGVFGFN